MTDRSRRGRAAMLWTDGGGRTDSARGIALLTSLLMIDSLHFVFARLLLPYIEPGPGAFYVMSFAALEVGILGLALGRLRLEPLLRLWPVFLAIGLCVAVSTNLNYAAMAYIDPGVASMVSKMAVPFSLCFGMLWLGERFSPFQSVGTAIALVGLTVISFQPGDYLGQGALMVLGSTLLYALHTALTKRHMGEVDLLNFFFYRLLLSSAILALVVGARGELALPSGRALPIILLVATVDVVISRFLYYWALRLLDMSIHTMALAASPVAAVLWSLFLFDVFPTALQLLGGAAILVGVSLVAAAPVWQRRRRRARAPS